MPLYPPVSVICCLYALYLIIRKYIFVMPLDFLHIVCINLAFLPYFQLTFFNIFVNECQENNLIGFFCYLSFLGTSRALLYEVFRLSIHSMPL